MDREKEGSILGIESDMEAAKKAILSMRNSSMPNKKAERTGKPFFRSKTIAGRPYWYLAQSIKINGKWKQKQQYIGIYKPRCSPEDYLKEHDRS